MTRTLWIPERSDEMALKIAYAVQAGRVPCLGQYLDEDRANLAAATLATLHGDPAFKARCVVIEMRTHDDGRIPVARIVDQIGELAAVLVLFAMIALVGVGSLYQGLLDEMLADAERHGLECDEDGEPMVGPGFDLREMKVAV